MKIDWLIGGLVVLGHAAAAQSQNAGEYLSPPPVTPPFPLHLSWLVS